MAAVVMRPAKAEQFDFLQLRQQLKDRIRMKKSRGSDAAHGRSMKAFMPDIKRPASIPSVSETWYSSLLKVLDEKPFLNIIRLKAV
ncbi:hypothetical protein D8674_003544 [Pyrus ussuriensis x Pyrus communis]|uniref:Uncharacterized protein n=1 Tax=Pyrus ussuriensis x Pyrus communis TaxID=2448454 RepID=A0A5N5FHD9_9ROSA|nr:hypothetical protein D8674_003544 [Pyrus ussuriensis x Pyrus communis]